MTLYYCINEVLDILDKMDGDDNFFQALIPVTTSPPECAGHPEDAFTLHSAPKLLDLREAESMGLLADLIESVPLYNINMELILDQALSERYQNTVVENALNQAFAGQPLPNTLKYSGQSEEDLSGGLRHPMLGHLDKMELCQLYVTFLKFLEREQDSYGFEENILGKHINMFLENFDGYATTQGGKIKAIILLAFGMRQDHDPENPIETFVKNGEKKARAMRIGEAHELVWAWLEADNYQMRRCRDLDRVLRLTGLPKKPNWVRTDVFSFLEKEAMKQVFAETLSQKDPGLMLLEQSKTLQTAIRINAEGQVDEALQQLLSQTLNQGAGYSGAAARFVEGAEKREREAKKASLG